MKIFKLMAIALVAMLGFTACEKDCDHDFIEVDHSKDLVGTWTCLQGEYAEALVIKADGSAVSTGYDGTEYWENVAGNIVVKNGTITMTFADNDNFKGHFDIVPGVAFSIFTEEGEHMTYNYCANDLTDEIVGMWVCTQVPTGNADDMFIQIFDENGKSIYTGIENYGSDNITLKSESSYKVVGNLDFLRTENDVKVYRLGYGSNATGLGDVMTFTSSKNNFTLTWLRVKQALDLTGTFDYSSAYVSNVKGTDEDFTILGHTFNMSNVKGGNFDMLFRSELFCVDLTANSIKHHFLTNDREVEVVTPITVDGNKVTLDFSAIVPALRKVDMYMFQDADATQLHMYMHTNDFINYFANLEIVTMLQGGNIDPADATAVAKVFSDMDARIESINVSFVLKARK